MTNQLTGDMLGLMDRGGIFSRRQVLWICVGFIPVGALVALLALVVAGKPELGGSGRDYFGQSEAKIHWLAVGWLAINAFRVFRFQLQPVRGALAVVLRILTTLGGAGLIAVIYFAVLSGEFDMRQGAVLPALFIILGPGLLLVQAGFVAYAAILSRRAPAVSN
ncbi:MAG: hypothetical protein ACRC20_16210 [Segniliparus sp.]|uniref:hypothetical protein n=1 Tax=Segniliparus sp. TaxID=2804064 RepID=UPI003F304A3C